MQSNLRLFHCLSDEEEEDAAEGLPEENPEGGFRLSLDQGLSKHQEVGFTPVTKILKLIVIFWDLVGAIQK